MVEPSGSEVRKPTGWALVRTLVQEFVHDLHHPTPRTLRYIRCDACGQVRTHSSARHRYTIQIAEREVTSTPPEAVCDCRHAHPRTVGDDVSSEATVTCVGRRYRRFGYKRSRRRCGREFAVPPDAAPAARCPWCATVQPGSRPG